MKFFRKFLIFAAVIPATFFATNNVDQNDLRARYNLTTQEPALCQVATFSHLSPQEALPVFKALLELHKEEGVPCIFNPKALNKEGKSPFAIAMEKYNETKCESCFDFANGMKSLERRIEDQNLQDQNLLIMGFSEYITNNLQAQP